MSAADVWNLFVMICMIWFFAQAFFSAIEEEWAKACFYLVLFGLFVPK
jgi:hypothetical protein